MAVIETEYLSVDGELVDWENENCPAAWLEED